MDKIKNLIPHLVLTTLTVFLYFFIRLVYKESVFFDFDMPRVALLVQDYLKNGSYMTSQSYVQESVWRNIPWGPSLIFFYSFFLKISSDPLVVADLLTIFNFLGIIAIVCMGWRFFSPTVGVLSGLLLATNPYWVSYSRIIYQPAPLITFLVISMFLTLLVIKEKNKIATFLLPITWVILFQIYIPTYAFIAVSLFFLIANYKQVDIKHFLFGILFSLILLIPSISFYLNNPTYLERFFTAPSLFTPPEKSFLERFIKVIVSFINIPVGGYFKWQTGYAYPDLLNYFPFISFATKFVSFVFVTSIIYLLVKIIKDNKNTLKKMVFWWSVIVVVSLLILWVTDLVPRYFLIAIPPSMLLMAIVINDLMVDFKNNRIIKTVLFSVPIAISIYWSVFNIKYDNFVRDYNYPNGKMYDIAETPYIHFKKSLDDIHLDSLNLGCSTFSVANDINDVNTVWMETTYLLKYVYNSENQRLDTSCNYFLVHRNQELELNYKHLINRRFGPFFVLKEGEVLKN